MQNNNENKISFFSCLSNGLITENPILVLMIGMCPTLAVTTSISNAIGMGISTTAVLVLSNTIVSLIRKITPERVRIPIYIVIVATFVTIVEFIIKAYFKELNEALGIYIPLIVVNCIILGRAEAFAGKNKVIHSIADGLGMGLGFTIGIILISALRELIGSGSLYGYELIKEEYRAALFVLPPGAFLVLAFLSALQSKLKVNKTGCSSGKCDSNCATCGISNKISEEGEK
ncbi:MAG: electron transport complex subunit E [Lachnospiraceae bacterium]|nr:electron transport complex subunit E [Lachnospiraceae bacterium]